MFSQLVYALGKDFIHSHWNWFLVVNAELIWQKPDWSPDGFLQVPRAMIQPTTPKASVKKG